jgi:hypothetical protein
VAQIGMGGFGFVYHARDVHLRIRALWADAACFVYPFLDFVHNVLHAPVDLYCSLRRQGKRFLATLFCLRRWGELSPRANIERHLAWLERTFGRNTSMFKATWP